MDKTGSVLGRRWPWLIRLFSWYVRRYVGRHFHAIRLARRGAHPSLPAGPVVVALTHPSWWDPLVAMLLTEQFSSRIHVAPIDDRALERYRFLSHLGFFGLEQHSRKGYEKLLAVAREMSSRDDLWLWMTPQGRFTDARQRPLTVRPGIGHVLHQMRGATFVPLALEYTFWDERLPEGLARFGAPVVIEDGRERTPEQWVGVVEASLEATADALADDAASRDPRRFEPVLSGRVGVGLVYDAWRALRAWVRGERFSAEHGSIIQESEAPR